MSEMRLLQTETSLGRPQEGYLRNENTARGGDLFGQGSPGLVGPARPGAGRRQEGGPGVSEEGRSVLIRYSLTAEGLELARKLAESEGLSSLDVDSRPEEPPGEEPEVPGTASAEL